MAVYQGPIKPGTSEKKFRETGKNKPIYYGRVVRWKLNIFILE